jgi:hypothetical protein
MIFLGAFSLILTASTIKILSSAVSIGSITSIKKRRKEAGPKDKI